MQLHGPARSVDVYVAGQRVMPGQSMRVQVIRLTVTNNKSVS